MLQTLSIRNYALIQELNIDLASGLSIITGETGAGKSILLGALSLIVGQRADTAVLLDKNSKCIVEGSFALKGYGLEDLFTHNDLDYEEMTVIRREISPDGKSRAFVNDTPVNLTVLRELGERLIDIHSQHQTLYLENPAFQLRILDTFAQQTEVFEKYTGTLDQYRLLKSKYDAIAEEAKKNSAELEFIKHQFDQLNQSKLEPNELSVLEEEIQTLSHAEEIKIALGAVSTQMADSEFAVIPQLKDSINQLSKLRNIYPRSIELFNRIGSMLIEAKDVAQETELLASHIEYDSERIEWVRQRLDLLYMLLQKHRVKTIDELIAIRDDFHHKIETVSNADYQLGELQKEIDRTRAVLGNLAGTITANRKKIIPRIEDRIQELLQQLAMPSAVFKVELTPTEEFTQTGTDKVRFMFSANKQGGLQDLAKVASGGEMARLMLSIKATIAETVTLPTIIFDEIDTGVSGDVADKMGNVIERMSSSAQIINITHLPQIASKGKNHFMVYKCDLDNRTQTQIKLLQSDERVIEIARMLSGEQLSEAAINNAKNLLGIR
jgi:DNA repair protein RecN (Recombination protein N)